MQKKICDVHGEQDLSRSNCAECGAALKKEETELVVRYAGKELTGIIDLKNRHVGVPVVILGSGTTLRNFSDDMVHEDWPIVAVNEAVAYGGRVDYWVLSDTPIVREYGKRCPKSVEILAMHQATLSIEAACPHNVIHTVQSELKASNFDDGYRFHSRGTVLIGAIEMMRYAGVKRFFCFGLDCYRERDSYYYDGRRPPLSSELKTMPSEIPRGLPRKTRVWVTSRLKHMIKKLGEVKNSGLWDNVEVFCVNSPLSQQTAIPKIDLEEFDDYKRKYVETKARTERRERQRKRRLQEKEHGLENPPSPEDRSGEDSARIGDASGPSDSSLVSGGGHEPADVPGQTDIEDSGILRDRDASGGNDEGHGGGAD